MAAEAPGPLASFASVAAAEEPPTLTGKEAAGVAGKDGAAGGSREAGDRDIGKEREGGGERPQRRQRRGALVEEVECARGGGAAAGGGDDDDNPFLLAGFISVFSAFS